MTKTSIKKPAPSNSRLSVKNVYTSSIKWSIDRLTIVGELAPFLPAGYTTNKISGEVKSRITIEDMFKVFEHFGHCRLSGNGYQMITDDGENVAYFERLKFDKNKGRLDFNPNKLDSFFENGLKQFISDLFITPHFSRADIAADIFDVPDEKVVSYRLGEPVGNTFFYGKSGDLQTAYFGARSSEKQIRLYNKRIERIKKGRIEDLKDPEQCYWRLELQLRRGRADDFQKQVDESLKHFYSPQDFPDDVSVNSRIFLKGLLADPDNWARISRPTKSKYRQIEERVASSDKLTIELKKTFSQQNKKIEKELKNWLQTFQVL